MWYEVAISASLGPTSTPDVGEHVLLFLGAAPNVAGPVVSQKAPEGRLTLRYSTLAHDADEADAAAHNLLARASADAGIQGPVPLRELMVTPEEDDSLLPV